MSHPVYPHELDEIIGFCCLVSPWWMKQVSNVTVCESQRNKTVHHFCFDQIVLFSSPFFRGRIFPRDFVPKTNARLPRDLAFFRGSSLLLLEGWTDLTVVGIITSQDDPHGLFVVGWPFSLKKVSQNKLGHTLGSTIWTGKATQDVSNGFGWKCNRRHEIDVHCLKSNDAISLFPLRSSMPYAKISLQFFSPQRPESRKRMHCRLGLDFAFLLRSKVIWPRSKWLEINVGIMRRQARLRRVSNLMKDSHFECRFIGPFNTQWGLILFLSECHAARNDRRMGAMRAKAQRDSGLDRSIPIQLGLDSQPQKSHSRSIGLAGEDLQWSHHPEGQGHHVCWEVARAFPGWQHSRPRCDPHGPKHWARPWWALGGNQGSERYSGLLFESIGTISTGEKFWSEPWNQEFQERMTSSCGCG